MAIYGINFTGTPIPTTPRSAFRKFPQSLRAPCRRCDGLGTEDAPDHDPIAGADNAHHCIECDGRGSLRYDLKGIGQSEGDLQAMLALAQNGTRLVHVEKRQTVGGVWYGVYTY
jgi:hypothetical protein